MSEDVHVLFDDFAAHHARGEHPDAQAYLQRAGERRDELARMLDGFLAAAPVQPPSEETIALFARLLPDPETPPLLAERVRRGWTRAEVVDWICERFAIGGEKRGKVAEFWHEVETGLLPVGGVSARLREALGQRFGEAALESRASVARPAGTFYRASDDAPAPARAAAEPDPPARDEPDEVDRLFGMADRQ